MCLSENAHLLNAPYTNTKHNESNHNEQPNRQAMIQLKHCHLRGGGYLSKSIFSVATSWNEDLRKATLDTYTPQALRCCANQFELLFDSIGEMTE